ncbi:site-specific DNA-methyltransferase, partial [Escherichia sp. HC-CC]
NTTGQVAESLGRRWITFEQRVDYVASSVFRFIEKGASEEVFNSLYNRILEGEDVEIKADNHEIVFD